MNESQEAGVRKLEECTAELRHRVEKAKMKNQTMGPKQRHTTVKRLIKRIKGVQDALSCLLQQDSDA